MTYHIDPVKLAELVSEGLSDRELAEVFSCDPRTILRRRQDHGIASQWTPPGASHGTLSRYRAGCRCEPCTVANSAYARAYTRRLQQASAAAHSFGEPWTTAEEAILLEIGASRASKCLGRTYFACTNRLERLRSDAAEVSR